MIKSKELQECADMLDALTAENEELRKQLKEKKNAEVWSQLTNQQFELSHPTSTSVTFSRVEAAAAH
jgi:hypothetical protein